MTTVDPEERGREDYKKGIFDCPYSPTSKAAKLWHKGKEDAALQEAMDSGFYDDEGSC